MYKVDAWLSTSIPARSVAARHSFEVPFRPEPGQTIDGLDVHSVMWMTDTQSFRVHFVPSRAHMARDTDLKKIGWVFSDEPQ